MPRYRIKIVGAADGGTTLHDGRWLVAWNPHTRFGTLELTSTAEAQQAWSFDQTAEALAQWSTISRKQPRRPTDGKPNRPLTAVTIELVAKDASNETES